MSTEELAGPDARAAWGVVNTGAATNRPQSLLFLPDSNSEQREAAGGVAVGYVLPQTPLLRYASSGAPVLSLTLLLSRMPDASADSVEPLIERATLSLDCTLDVPADILQRLNREQNVEYRPLFARHAVFTLQDGDITLAEAEGTGADAHVALTANLTRSAALAVLAALQDHATDVAEPGQASTLNVQCQVSFRTANAARHVRLLGNWAAIHDFISTRVTSPSEFNGEILTGLLAAMIASGTLRVIDVATQQPLRDLPTANLQRSFLRVASVILQRQTYELPADDSRNIYVLRGRPHVAMNLDYSEIIESNEGRSVVLRTTLEPLLRGALTGRAWDAHVHLVALGDPNTGIGAPPRRVRTASARRDPRADAAAPLKLVNLGATATSLASVVRPNVATGSTAAIAVRPVGTWLLEDATLTRPTPTARSLPVVDDVNAALWPDRVDPNRFWYAPDFAVVQPAPSDDPSSAAFAFEYQVIGATADGEPAIKASIRLQLRETMPDATRSALRLRGDPHAGSVAATDITAQLDVPFVDAASGQTRSQRFPARLNRSDGTLTATIELLNDWARLCYGALAVANFQQQPARLIVSYAFNAYTPMRANLVHMVWGAKTALTPVVFSTDELRSVKAPVVFDAIHGTVKLVTGELQLHRETRAVRTDVARLVAGGERFAAASVAAITRPVALRPTHAAAALIAARPELVKPVVNPNLWDSYMERAVGHSQQTDALLPCNTFGALYTERTATEVRAIGCRDALKLGTVDYRQYEEMIELRCSDYAVHRSLQQPGRFLVVPTYYRITRHPAGLTNAYRPCALLYCLLDNDNPTASQVVFEATLQPDLSTYQRAALRAELRTYAANPILQFPTEVMTDATYTWTISGSLAAPQVVELPDGLQISISTALTQGLLLQDMLGKSGIFGSVEFELPDGTVLRAGLALELRDMTGPWQGGPLELTLDDAGMRITNRIEQTLAVAELALFAATGTLQQRVTVEATIAPGATHTIAMNGASAATITPIYTQTTADAMTLSESRVFVEDITTNVIFFIQLNYSNHDVQRLDIQARLKNDTVTYDVALTGDPPQGTLELVLPLTRYLAKQVLQFQITKTFTSAAPSATPWIDWDMEAHGNIIAVTWDMIA